MSQLHNFERKSFSVATRHRRQTAEQAARFDENWDAIFGKKDEELSPGETAVLKVLRTQPRTIKRTPSSLSVGELRKKLAELPEDMPVVLGASDHSYRADVSAHVVECKPDENWTEPDGTESEGVEEALAIL